MHSEIMLQIVLVQIPHILDNSQTSVKNLTSQIVQALKNSKDFDFSYRKERALLKVFQLQHIHTIRSALAFFKTIPQSPPRRPCLLWSLFSEHAQMRIQVRVLFQCVQCTPSFKIAASKILASHISKKSFIRFANRSLIGKYFTHTLLGSTAPMSYLPT